MTDYSRLYSIGQGEAQVFDSSGIINQYSQQLQQQGLRRQKEQEAYAKELSAINYDGVRQADVSGAHKRWAAVKDKYYELSKTNTDYDKLRIRSEIASLKNDLTSFSKRSIEEQKTTADIAKIPLVKNKYEIANDFGDSLKGRELLSIEDPRFNEYGVSRFQAVSKPYDTTKNLMDLAALSSTEKEIPIVIGTGLDARRAYQRGKVIDEVAFKSAFLKNIAEDDHAKDTYLNGLEYTPENLQDAAESAFAIVKDKHSLTTTESNLVNPSGRELSMYRQKAAISDSYKDDDSSPSSTFEESTVIPFGKPKDNSFVKVFNTQKLSPSRINITGTEGINLITGKPMRVPNLENSVSISTIADVPIIGGSLKLGGRVAQPKFAQDNPDKVKYKRHAFVTFKDGSGTDQTLLIPIEALPTTNKVINQALKSMPTETYKHPKAASPKNEYSNVRTLVGKDGKSVQAGIKDGKWFNISTGKTL